MKIYKNGEWRNIETKSTVDALYNKIIELTNDINKLKLNIKDIINDYDINELKINIDDLENDINNIDNEINDLNNDRDGLKLLNDEQNIKNTFEIVEN